MEKKDINRLINKFLKNEEENGKKDFDINIEKAVIIINLNSDTEKRG